MNHDQWRRARRSYLIAPPDPKDPFEASIQARDEADLIDRAGIPFAEVPYNTGGTIRPREQRGQGPGKIALLRLGLGFLFRREATVTKLFESIKAGLTSKAFRKGAMGFLAGFIGAVAMSMDNSGTFSGAIVAALSDKGVVDGAVELAQTGNIPFPSEIIPAIMLGLANVLRNKAKHRNAK